MNIPLPKTSELIAIQLRYQDVGVPLRTRATAQILAKVLFLESNKTFTQESLASALCVATGLIDYPSGEIVSAIEYLRSTNWLNRKGPIGLTAKARKEIERSLKAKEQTLEGVLDRHFPQKIPRSILIDWFLEVGAKYFGEFGTHAVTTSLNLVRNSGSVANQQLLADVAMEASQQTGLSGQNDILVQGFSRFLQGQDRDSQALIWTLWQSAFSARLIQAKLGAEPVTSDLLAKSMVFLDTNILISAVLPADARSKKLRLLLKTLRSMGCTLFVLPSTIQEYQGRVEQARGDILRVSREFPLGVVMRAKDDFLQEALSRGCQIDRDFERFFDDIDNPVVYLSDDFDIIVCSNSKLLAAIADIRNDKDFGDQIAEVWSRSRPEKKRENAIIHDSELLGVVEAARESCSRAWALTLDWTLPEVARERSRHLLPPTAIHFQPVVEILAIDFGGPKLRAEEFGALLGAIISSGLEPTEETYTVGDLALLLDIEARCAELPEDTILDIAARVAEARLAGRSKDDRELHLEINRIFQDQRLRVVGERDWALAELARAEDRLKEERALRCQAERELREKAVLEEKAEKRRELIFMITGAAGYSVMMALLGYFLLGMDSLFVRTAGGACVALALAGPATIWKKYRRYLKQLRSMDRD